jgi:hypothetical protein
VRRGKSRPAFPSLGGSRRRSRRIAAALSSLFPLSFQAFHSPIDGGDQFIVPLALGPSLFRSQHVGELGQQVAFEHGVNFSSVSLPMAVVRALP